MLWIISKGLLLSLLNTFSPQWICPLNLARHLAAEWFHVCYSSWYYLFSWLIYIDICIYLYIYVYIYIYVSTHIYIYMYMHTHMHTRINKHRRVKLLPHSFTNNTGIMSMRHWLFTLLSPKNPAQKTTSDNSNEAGGVTGKYQHGCLNLLLGDSWIRITPRPVH